MSIHQGSMGLDSSYQEDWAILGSFSQWIWLFDIFKGKESPVSHKMELSFAQKQYLGMYVWCLSCRVLSLATSFTVLLGCWRCCMASNFEESDVCRSMA
jgi:hypothetical protein